ncbi:Protein C56A3.5 [Aphelenchoides avenae]|nr:Protein C56A3.5 [Aphelenchus avenae]
MSEVEKERIRKQLSEDDGKVILWAKSRRTLVEPTRSVVMRVRDASNFGMSMRGFVRESGEVFTIEWTSAMNRFAPTALHVVNSANPLRTLTAALADLGKETAEKFLSKLRLISLEQTDILYTDIVELLKHISLLPAFSFSDVNFSDSEHQSLFDRLAELQVQVLQLSGGDLTYVFSQTCIQILSLAGAPGLKTADFVQCTEPCVSCKCLYAQELNFGEDTPDAEVFLDQVPRLFPHLEVLLWDWNMVDPEVAYDERTKLIVDKLIGIFNNPEGKMLRALGVVMYTPDAKMRNAAEQICRQFSDIHPMHCDIFKFASSANITTENFSLLLVANDAAMAERVRQVVVVNRKSKIDSLTDLSYILSGGEEAESLLSMASSTLTLDFGGFDNNLIREKLHASHNEP